MTLLLFNRSSALWKNRNLAQLRSKDQLTLSLLDFYTGVKPTSQGKRRDVLIHCFSPLVFKPCFKSLRVLKEKYGHERHVSFVSTPLPSGPIGLRVLGY